MAAAVKETVNSLLSKLNLGSKDDGIVVKEPTEQELKQLREKYAHAGQEQVFTFYDGLSTGEKSNLFGRLASIDPEYINQITRKALNPQRPESHGEAELEPLPESATASILDSPASDIDGWYSSGLDLVAKGQVAVVLMAGGQGTRLGSSAPKGCFNIGLPSQKSLFQIQAERIIKVQKLAGKKSGAQSVVIPWYVMTSGPTRRPTEEFFQQHNYFGLCKDDVIVFEQGVLPCISNDGKILLETKSKVHLFHRGRLSKNLQLSAGCRCSRRKWRHLSGTTYIGCA
jgi:UDP-N-acetylglucosamine/UDP-N-acetylgalactosamine diphosphorylase